MAITIGDVAREANVSMSTISRVINSSKSVSPELRERVYNAIEKTGYRPNALARGLITNRTHTVGLVVSDISNSVIAMIAKGIDSVCLKKGYTVFMCESDGNPEKEFMILDKLSDHRIDGLIFLGFDINKTLTDKMLSMDFPVVLVNQEESYGETRITTISYDNYQATYDTVRLLISAGHRRIAFIGGPNKDYSAGQKRLAGYKQALEDAGIKADGAYIQSGDFGFQSGYDAMKRIYEESFELPSAVVASSDLMAVGAMQCVSGYGLCVPDDISIIGFDDSEIAQYTQPSLATVRIPYFEEGTMAADTLFHLMDEMASGREINPEVRYVDYTLIRRRSLAQRK